MNAIGEKGDGMSEFTELPAPEMSAEKAERVNKVCAQMASADEGFPHLETDVEARAAYVCLTSREIVRTVEVSDLVHVDLDVNGAAVGVEILTLPPGM